MTATGQMRGHRVTFDGVWRYDDGTLATGDRPCTHRRSQPMTDTPATPTTEAARITAHKVCWALHALTTEHNPDCTVIRESLGAIEAEARSTQAEALRAEGAQEATAWHGDCQCGDPCRCPCHGLDRTEGADE